MLLKNVEIGGWMENVSNLVFLHLNKSNPPVFLFSVSPSYDTVHFTAEAPRQFYHCLASHDDYRPFYSRCVSSGVVLLWIQCCFFVLSCCFCLICCHILCIGICFLHGRPLDSLHRAIFVNKYATAGIMRTDDGGRVSLILCVRGCHTFIGT